MIDLSEIWTVAEADISITPGTLPAPVPDEPAGAQRLRIRRNQSHAPRDYRLRPPLHAPTPRNLCTA